MIDTSAGWVKIWRKIRDWEWYMDANTFRVFFHVLINANYEDKKWHGILIRRGQYLTSVRKLSTDLKISVQQTRTALSNIQTTHEVTIETTHQYTLITVENYDSYQIDDREDNTVNNTEDNTQSNTASTHKVTQLQHSINTAPTTTEEYKNTKNINNTRNKTLNINNNNARVREEEPVDDRESLEEYRERFWREHGGEAW